MLERLLLIMPMLILTLMLAICFTFLLRYKRKHDHICNEFIVLRNKVIEVERTLSDTLLKEKHLNLTEEDVDILVLLGNEPLSRWVEIKQFIGDHCFEANFSQQLVADEFGISIAYLSRQFKKYFGINMSEYVSQLKINRAKELLIKTDYTIKQIADILGYADTSNFISRFSRIVNTTPGQYRKTVLGGQI